MKKNIFERSCKIKIIPQNPKKKCFMANNSSLSVLSHLWGPREWVDLNETWNVDVSS